MHRTKWRNQFVGRNLHDALWRQLIWAMNWSEVHNLIYFKVLGSILVLLLLFTFSLASQNGCPFEQLCFFLCFASTHEKNFRHRLHYFINFEICTMFLRSVWLWFLPVSCRKLVKFGIYHLSCSWHFQVGNCRHLPRPYVSFRQWRHGIGRKQHIGAGMKL